MNSKQTAIYFGDMMGDIEEERDHIIKECAKFGVTFERGIKAVDMPPFKEHFNVLFFDWGGMSMGNSVLESFCREIYKQHKDFPSRYYIMCSSFTEDAMRDAVREFGEKPTNIFYTIEEFCKEYVK